MRILDRDYITNQVGKFSEANYQGRIYHVVTSVNMVAAALIKGISELNIPFKVLNLGAGVKKITNDLGVCPKCNGSGKC